MHQLISLGGGGALPSLAAISNIEVKARHGFKWPHSLSVKGGWKEKRKKKICVCESELLYNPYYYLRAKGSVPIKEYHRQTIQQACTQANLQ